MRFPGTSIQKFYCSLLFCGALLSVLLALSQSAPAQESQASNGSKWKVSISDPQFLDNFLQLQDDNSPEDRDRDFKGTFDHRVFKVIEKRDWYYIVETEGEDGNGLKRYRTSAEYFNRAITENKLKAHSGGSQVPADALIENGSTVFLTSEMNCRSSANWHGIDNIIGLQASGSQGLVRESLVKNNRVIGYRISFESGESCWIHAPGVQIQNETVATAASNPEVCPPTRNQPEEMLPDSLKPFITDSDRIAEDSERCKKPYPKCNTDLPRNRSLEEKVNQYIVDAANELKIPPQLIKAQLAAETSFLGDGKLENTSEKNTYLAYLKNPQGVKMEAIYRGYLWGRGDGQFGADNAPDYGMAWYQSAAEIESLHPDHAAELKNLRSSDTSRYNQRRQELGFYLPGDIYKGKRLRNVYDHEPAIWAKAEMLAKNYRQVYEVTVNDREGEPKKINAALAFSETERHRLAVAAYNRGSDRVHKSILAFAINHAQQDGDLVSHPLPSQYAQIAFEPVPESMKSKWDKSRLLFRQKISHCHVFKIIGICGRSTGFFEQYSADFRKASNGSWSLA